MRAYSLVISAFLKATPGRLFLSDPMYLCLVVVLQHDEDLRRPQGDRLPGPQEVKVLEVQDLKDHNVLGQLKQNVLGVNK